MSFVVMLWAIVFGGQGPVVLGTLPLTHQTVLLCHLLLCYGPWHIYAKDLNGAATADPNLEHRLCHFFPPETLVRER
jgi:hypothetical protein